MKDAAIEYHDVGDVTRWNGRIVYARRGGEITTLQAALVAAGAARVDPQTEDHEFITQLLTLEREARGKRRGLWALPDYRVVDASFARKTIGAFHLVEGEVAAADRARSRLYLNFGADYVTDFTAGARNALYRKWTAEGLDLATLKGARLRLRGFVNDINGPSVDLKHIKQIEVLTP